VSADLACALRLLAGNGGRLGGIWLRGGAGAGRERALAEVERAFAGRPVRRVPLNIDEDRLAGGIDVGASLAAGRAVRRPGLVDEAAGGVLVLTSAERVRPAVAGRLGAGLDASLFALVLLEDGSGEASVPAVLANRVGLVLDLDSAAPECVAQDGSGTAPAFAGVTRKGGPDTGPAAGAGEGAPDLPEALASVAEALGVAGTRPLLFAMRAAQAAAGLDGREAVTTADAALAVRLVLGPRATRVPAEAPPEPPAPSEEQSEPGEGSREPKLDELLVAAAKAVLPAGLDLEPSGRSARGPAPRSCGSGERRRTPIRGRPVGARQGVPRGGMRLALIETLRAAAPWQGVRRPPGEGRVQLRREDLRVRRFEERAETLTIFAVDASGSAAFARLAEAKGAVELMLARAYAQRAEVALIAFRGEGAQLLLPPTRSLTRARRLLAELPGGGGTPLAAGLDAARLLAEGAVRRGRTPRILLLTDGRANIAADGAPGRAQANADAVAAARRIAATSVTATVIDISPRPQAEAERLAGALAGRYLHLPRAPAAALQAAAAQ